MSDHAQANAVGRFLGELIATHEIPRPDALFMIQRAYKKWPDLSSRQSFVRGFYRAMDTNGISHELASLILDTVETMEERAS